MILDCIVYDGERWGASEDWDVVNEARVSVRNQAEMSIYMREECVIIREVKLQ